MSGPENIFARVPGGAISDFTGIGRMSGDKSRSRTAIRIHPCDLRASVPGNREKPEWKLAGGVRHPPDGAGGVVGDEQGAVMGDGDADRAAPDLAVVDHEAGEEILVFAGRYAVLQQHADHLAAGAAGAVP